MKFLKKILILIIIILAIFFSKDYIFSLYNNNFLSIKSSIQSLKNYVIIHYNNNYNKTVEKITEVKENIQVSEPLKSINNIIQDKNIKLSKNNIILLTNQYRKENGLAELKENNKLNLSALKKAEDILSKQYFEHVSPSGVGVGDLGELVSYEYIIIGENLALGNFENDKALVDAWIASQGHRENILNKKYTEIGISVLKGKYEKHDVWVAVQHFGLPKNTCPPIDNTLFKIIESNQLEIDKLLVILGALGKEIDIMKGESLSSKIDYYNTQVTYYNNLIKEIKEKIKSYNSQVESYNSCISSYTEN
jgi:uncharacterized protein YkwD